MRRTLVLRVRGKWRCSLPPDPLPDPLSPKCSSIIADTDSLISGWNVLLLLLLLDTDTAGRAALLALILLLAISLAF